MRKLFRYRWQLVFHRAAGSPVLMEHRSIPCSTRWGAERCIRQDAQRMPSHCSPDGKVVYGDPLDPVEWGQWKVEHCG